MSVEAVRAFRRQCLVHRLHFNTENTKDSRSSTKAFENSSPIINRDQVHPHPTGTGLERQMQRLSGQGSHGLLRQEVLDRRNLS
ncbi:MAG: hypothetical protein ACJ8AW_14985, partial [Rhodopila sp.]